MKQQCPHCKVTFQIDATKIKGAVQFFRCPSCLQPVKVGAPKPAAPPTDDPFWQPPTLDADATTAPAAPTAVAAIVPPAATVPTAAAAPPPPSTPPEAPAYGDLDLPTEDAAPKGKNDEEPQFGSMADYDLSADDSFGDVSSPAPTPAAAKPVVVAPAAKKAAAPIKVVTVAPAAVAATDTSTHTNAATDDVWSQMSEMGNGERAASISNEDDLVASLQTEKQKVNQEMNRLDQLSARMASTTPREAPRAIANSQVKPLPAKRPPTAARTAPPATPVTEMDLAAAAPVPPQTVAFQNSKPPSETSQVKRAPVPPSASHKLAPILIAGIGGLLAFVLGGVFFSLGSKKQPVKESELAKEFSQPTATVASGTSVADQPNSPAADLATAAPISPTITPTAEPVATPETRNAYDIGLAAYQQHNLTGYREAEKQWIVAYKEEQRSPRSTLALAELWAILGDRLNQPELLKKSFQMAQAQLTNAEFKPQALRALAQAYYFSHLYPQAMEQIQKSLALNPNDPEAFLIRGLILNKTKQGGGGLLQAYKLNPQSFRIAQEMTLFYLSDNRHVEARQVAKGMIQSHAARHEGYLYALQAANKEGLWVEAQAYASQAMQLAPRDLAVNLEVANLHLARGEEKQASEQVELFLASATQMPRSDLARSYQILAKANLNQDPTKAIFYLEKLMVWEVDSVATFNSLGLAHFNKKEFQKSADYFARALRLSPESLPIKFNLGLTHFNAASLDRAAQLFQEILNKNPRHEDANFYLAALYQKRGERIKAIEGFDLVLRINPGNRQAQQQLKFLKSGGN